MIRFVSFLVSRVTQNVIDNCSLNFEKMIGFERINSVICLRDHLNPDTGVFVTFSCFVGRNFRLNRVKLFAGFYAM